jgi:hypothetical protein
MALLSEIKNAPVKHFQDIKINYTKKNNKACWDLIYILLKIKKINKNVFNHQFILYWHSQLVTGARDPDMIATFITLSLSYFNVMT